MKFRDINDEILAELKKLRQELGSSDPEDTETADVSTPEPESTGTYYSTGSSLIELTDGDWYDFPLGFMAREVRIQHSDAIDVAFRSPYESSSSVIPLDGSGEFTMGGSPPLKTAFVWVRKADNATANPQITITAY